ncbi:MAG: hypothetical protein QXU32_09700 [Nitrososphaerales archaeon]
MSSLLIPVEGYLGVFVSIAIGVVLAVLLVEVAIRYNVSLYLYPIIWIVVLSGVIFAFRLKYANMFAIVGFRFRQSLCLPFRLRLVDGICWAVLFAIITLFPNHRFYLILLGIGLGNTSSFLVMRKIVSVNFYEHLIVRLISLVTLPMVIGLHSLHLLSAHLLEFLGRLFIAFAYVAGGMYGVVADAL